LQIFTDGKRIRYLVKELAEPPKKLLEVHFLKLDKEVIEMETIQSQLLISSLRKNAINSLY
jgi:hypothetical protein